MGTSGWWVVLGAGALVGCGGGALEEGEARFEAGEAPLAAYTLGSIEGEARGWDGPLRAEYALFRGLIYAELGDRGRAGFWLAEAKAIEDARPGSLRVADSLRLAAALAGSE